MAHRWEQAGGISQQSWEDDAAHLYRNMPGFQAIGWVDTSYVVRWIVPMEGNEAAKDLDLSFEARRREALDSAREKHMPIMTQSIDLVQGGKGFIVFVPIYVDDVFAGFTSGVFRMHTLIGGEVEGARRGLTICEGDAILYGASLDGRTATRQLDIHGNSWELQVGEEEAEDTNTYSSILMTIGCLLALMMGAVVRLAQTSRLRAEDAERATRELRKREGDLRAARDAAEKASRVKSEFLTNMSHEIRTPMNGVLGFTELLLSTAITHTQEEYLRIVQTSADSLLTVINDILDFSQIEVGQLRLNPITFCLRDVIISTIAIFSSHARQKSLNLRCKIPDNLPAAVAGDADRLRQVLVNLLGNAIKFTDSGSVTLNVQADTSGAHVDLCLEVVDTGLGIDDGQMARIFEGFAQVDGSLTRAYSGTGLGLAISQQLAEMMGGKIEVESKPGEGSTFRFCVRFPIVDAPVSVATLPPHTGASAKTTVLLPRDRRCVLVAEDNPINQMLTRSHLRLYSIDVRLAESGPEVLQQWREGKVDLILMDVQLPTLSGLDTTRRIREYEAQNGGHIPIIALTARAMKGDREECLAAGMDDYVTKPFTREQLMAALNRQLGMAINISPTEESESSAAGRDLSAMHAAFDDLLLLRRMVTEFLGNTPRQLEELSQALQAGDARSVAEFADLLRDSCRALEFAELAAIAHALEPHASNDDLGEAQEQLEHLLADFAVLEGRLRGWLTATAP
ncbi:MAG: signal transduction histidine kinase/CheY-like chemotaxis protein [Rhodothermales bacterium]|jgi:signal transduction histidine kinase/CheY-like chemotaxis protein/HPt (histidine-containing phosphotransfer) domain-containing protein